MQRVITAALAIAFTCVMVGPATAAIVHPDAVGAQVEFRNITEDSPSGNSLPLYGPATASGNSIDFNPTGGFAASSTNGAGTDFVDGKLSLMIVAKPGSVLSTVSVLESGLATLFRQSAGDPFASVSGLIDVDINEVDGTAITPIELDGVMMSYNPSGGTYQHSEDVTGMMGSISWSGGATIDLMAALTASQTAFTSGVTKITVTLDNILLASTLENGNLASIDKKDFDISVTTDGGRIPEPSSVALIGLACTAVLPLRRRLMGARS